MVLSANKNFCRLVAACAALLFVQSCHLTNFPSSAEQWDKQARTKYLREEYALACDDWDRAINLKPENAEWYYMRSRACIRFGRDQQAVDDAKKAIEVLGNKDPRKLIYFYLQLGIAHVKKAQFPEAEAAYKKALELANGNVDAAPVYMELGRVETLVGELEEAIDHLSKSIALVPTLGRAYFLRAKAYRDAGMTAKADQDLQTSKDMNYEPDNDRWEPLPVE